MPRRCRSGKRTGQRRHLSGRAVAGRLPAVFVDEPLLLGRQARPTGEPASPAVIESASRLQTISEPARQVTVRLRYQRGRE